ncbi:ubiquinone/menaquinone biosynthesis C-methylase UbiE [Stella humosa]|uniref:Ubiquinone/menaquinone biosynthesis C-methylase UbiE n=1 Tax=Stella humosa TaxID=94 RepID=A0A3N1KTL7_9PROT|nr:class I SAM-dependent methyltransferase [Stella humosa]ROP81456.1 ubiquinone/menaquinone biosynthesis C-methylase UbiE [Stella humosa]BBK32809.1 methyltransferase [Stella humosa]
MSTITPAAPAAPAFDAARYKETTRAQWQDAARAWNEWSPLLRDWLGPATETMLDMARIGPGCRVLDVAAGAGDQTLQAARRVGPAGHVLATDIAPAILEFAWANARAAGLANVTTQAMDGEAIDVAAESFDAVISRVGLIYFPDQQKALAGMRRALKPGGHVAAIVYGPAERNGFFAIPVGIIRRRAGLPPPAPGQPGPFSLGGPGVLEAAFHKAGFRDVETRSLPAPVRTPNAAECVRFEKESFGALHQMMAGLDAAGREAAWQEIEEALGAFEGSDGFAGPCEMIVGIGVK